MHIGLLPLLLPDLRPILSAVWRDRAMDIGHS